MDKYCPLFAERIREFIFGVDASVSGDSFCRQIELGAVRIVSGKSGKLEESVGHFVLFDARKIEIKKMNRRSFT